MGRVDTHAECCVLKRGLKDFNEDRNQQSQLKLHHPGKEKFPFLFCVTILASQCCKFGSHLFLFVGLF